jgi:hypothetical protein
MNAAIGTADVNLAHPILNNTAKRDESKARRGPLKTF